MKKLLTYTKTSVFIQQYALWIILLTSLFPLPSIGQTELIDEGAVYSIGPTGELENYQGTYQDFRIPEDPLYDFIEFNLRGADGGRALAGNCNSWGGDGATVRFMVAIGDQDDQIPAGSTLRFIVGKNGGDHFKGRSDHAFAGGGGGTAIFLKKNGIFGTVLGVAGGGGGAFQRNVAGDCYNSNPGQGGRASESGGDGAGNDAGAGGENGGGGESVWSGGGGGWLTSSGGKRGRYIGGEGGVHSYNGVNGGYGCGGGGQSDDSAGFSEPAAAGGGGGYSGGGCGGVSSRGGGGGSYVHPTLVFNAQKTAGGNTEGTDYGVITYQFKCYPQFSAVSVIQDAYCHGSEVIQFNYKAKSYCPGTISFKWPAAGEENTDGIFGNDQPLLPGQTYGFELYYDGELVDTYSYTVDSEVDDAAPVLLCSLPITIDLNQDNTQTVQAGTLITGTTDDCRLTVAFLDGSTSKIFDCSSPLTSSLKAVATDPNNNSTSCTVPVTLVGKYPRSVTVDEETVYLDGNGQAQLSTGDLFIAPSEATVCYTKAQILANYSLPAQYHQLDCDDVGVHNIALDKVDPDFPDAVLELTVVDDIPITASVAPINKTLTADGTAVLNTSDLNFTVSDNCYTDAELIGAYTIPAQYSALDCSDLGVQFIKLDKSDTDFPDVFLQLTVTGSSLDLPAVTTDFCGDQPFDLTSLEDQITTASGSFQYFKSTERLYVPNYGDGTVSVIDLSDHSLLTTISVGTHPSGVAVSPDGLKVYVANYSSNNISVIDVSSNQVIATVSVGANPWGVAVSPDGTRVYVSNHGDHTVSIIDALTNTVIGGPVNVGGGPVGLAVSTAGDKVFVANQDDNTVSVLRTADNSVKTITVESNPTGVARSADGTAMYVTNKFGSATTPASISVIDISTETVTDNIPTATQEATDLAVSPNGKIYTAHNSSRDGAVNLIQPGGSPQASEILLEGSVFNILNGISLNADGSELYVADHINDKVFVLETTGNTQTATIPVGDFPFFYGDFYQKADLPISDPTSHSPTAGEVITVVFDGGGAGCEAVTTITFGEENADLCGGVSLRLTAMLEGPYDANFSRMNIDLKQQDLLPDVDPYTDSGINAGSIIRSSTGNNAIVDWILLELRSEVDPSVVLYSRPVLLRRDGTLIDSDGAIIINWKGVSWGRYYVALRHRNHLGIMTATARNLGDNWLNLDFTDASTAVYGDNSRVKVSDPFLEVGGGVWAMFSSDTDGSGTIDAADRSFGWNDRNLSGYLDSDCNLDGTTDAADRSMIWNNRNVGGTLPE